MLGFGKDRADENKKRLHDQFATLERQQLEEAHNAVAAQLRTVETELRLVYASARRWERMYTVEHGERIALENRVHSLESKVSASAVAPSPCEIQIVSGEASDPLDVEWSTLTGDEIEAHNAAIARGESELRAHGIEPKRRGRPRKVEGV